MLKNKSKFVVLLLAFLLVVSTFSFATDAPVTTSNESDVTSTIPGDNAKVEGETANETPTTTTTETPEIYNGDLYVFDNNIEMNQLVDGNVFLFGNNINVTGKVNGSLYAFGQNIKFGADSYIVQSIYAMGNTVTLDGSASDLYILARKVDMSYDSFAIRDLRIAAETFNFNGGVGRDAFVTANNFNFATEEDKAAIVYGNLTYSSPNELSLTSDLVQGNINYNKEVVKEESVTEKIIDKVINLCNTLLYVLVVFFLCLWLAPKFLAKTSDYISAKGCATSLGIGILTTIAISLVSIGLLFTVVGLPIGFALIALLVLLLSIATAVTCTSITYKLKEKFGYTKNYITYLTLTGIVIVVWALGLIPFVGWLISFVVKMIGLGIIIHYLFTKKCIDSSKKEITKTNTSKEKPVKKEKKEKPKKEKTTQKEDKKKE